MIITIPFKTPTINHLYWHRGNMKIITKEAKELREQIKKIVHSQPMSLKLTKLEVKIKIYENWYTKKGEIKRKDVSNREKFLIDSVFDALGIDDKFIFKSTMEKIQSEEEESIIEIKNMEFK